MDKDTLKDLVASRLSIEEILDILGWDVPELVEYLEEPIMEQEVEFRKAVDE
jgi:hypothetical protein